MEESLNEKRKKRIKLRYYLFPTECNLCRKLIHGEKMWKVERNAIKYGQTVTFHYCQRCMHSVEDVLNEIDTDAYPRGIAGIDSPLTFTKKNFTGSSK